MIKQGHSQAVYQSSISFNSSKQSALQQGNFKSIPENLGLVDIINMKTVDAKLSLHDNKQKSKTRKRNQISHSKQQHLITESTINEGTGLPFEGLPCILQLREDEVETGIQFRDCAIDYTRCPNHNCIRKLT